MAQHVALTCDDCGQTDDHPKLHYGLETYHHDCLPPRVRRDVMGDGSHPVHAMVRKIIKECESGTKGDDLRQFIFDEHDGLDVPPAADGPKVQEVKP